MTKNCRPSKSGFALIKGKTTSKAIKAIIKRYAEIGSPCLVPLSNLKYDVVLPPFLHNTRFRVFH